MPKIDIKDHSKGFTIVELLIVVVIIGILATIVIVAYSGIQNRATNNVVQSDLRLTMSNINQFHAINGYYPSTQSDLTGLAIASSKYYLTTSNSYIYCKNTSTAGVLVRSKSGDTYMGISNGGITQLDDWPAGGASAVCSAAGINANYAPWGFTGGSWQPWVKRV